MMQSLPTSQGLPFGGPLDKTPAKLTKALLFLVWIYQPGLSPRNPKHSPQDPNKAMCLRSGLFLPWLELHVWPRKACCGELPLGPGSNKPISISFPVFCWTGAHHLAPWGSTSNVNLTKSYYKYCTKIKYTINLIEGRFISESSFLTEMWMIRQNKTCRDQEKLIFRERKEQVKTQWGRTEPGTFEEEGKRASGLEWVKGRVQWEDNREAETSHLGLWNSG